jgi:hypothetical protein
VADALNHTNQFVFDGVGRNVKTIFADNTFVTNVFKLLAQQVAKIDQASNMVSYAFDISDQRTNVMMPSVPDPEHGNNAINPAWTYAFDQYGRQLATIDARSHPTTNVFDVFGREIARRGKSSEHLDEREIKGRVGADRKPIHLPPLGNVLCYCLLLVLFVSL